VTLTPRLSRAQGLAVFGALVLVVAVVAYALNWLTPLVSDDFGIVASMRGVTTFHDFARTVGGVYQSWDGRILGYAIGRWFAMLDKGVFNVANALAFVVFTVLVYLHARGRGRPSPALYGFIVLGTWFLVPVFGQVFLWMAGSTNYLWTMLFVLAFMLPYRWHVDRSVRDGLIIAVLVFVLGIAAGWSSPNVSPGVIVWVVLMIRFCAKRGTTVTRWMWSGLAGCVIGFIALLAAPGNYARAAVAGGSGLIERIFRYLYWLANEQAVALVLIIAAMVVYGLVTSRLQRGDAAMGLAFVYCAAAAVAAALMIAAPDYPLRAFLGSATFLIVAAGILLMRLEVVDRRVALVVTVAAAVGVFALAAQLAGAAYDIKTTKDLTEARGRYIEAQKAAGHLDITVASIVPKTVQNPLYKLYDVTGSPVFWSNQHLADYYGVHSITGRLPDE
jgi:hypothetical protein